MFTQRSNRKANASRRRRNSFALVLTLFGLAPLFAFALSTDKQQNMLINSDYSKIVQNTNNNAPGVTYLTGNVTMDQGTTKARGDEATLYQHPGDSKDAQGKDNSGDIQRVIVIGKKKQAHLEQQQDAGGLFTANSDKIDYNADTSVAVLTGNVVVVQPGRGQFKGAYMVYNTNTGEMESGDKSNAGQRVSMVIEPKNKPPADGAKPAAATTPTATPADAAKPATSATKKKKHGAKTNATTPAATTPSTTPATPPTATPPTTGSGEPTPSGTPR
jgi:lipopolysaccharide export system protein LptA